MRLKSRILLDAGEILRVYATLHIRRQCFLSLNRISQNRSGIRNWNSVATHKNIGHFKSRAPFRASLRRRYYVVFPILREKTQTTYLC
jgi:hypothetical protein